MDKQELINNLFATWDPIAVKRFGRSFIFDEYKSYANEVLIIPNAELKNYLIKIYTDMVQEPDSNDLIVINTIEELIRMIKGPNK